MKIKLLLSAVLVSIAMISANAEESNAVAASDSTLIVLPAPQLTDTMTVGEALQNRSSQRAFAPNKDLDKQTLSNLLWAAWGYNRENKRTAPTARDVQDITLYVFLSDGVYSYDARKNTLELITKKDLRAKTGMQPFVATAPVNIVFVVNTRKLNNAVMSAVGCGAVSQNIYLYCASAGLSTVVRGSFDEKQLRRVLPLRPDEVVMLAQSVGYPAEN